MKKRYLILAGVLMAAQIMSAMPTAEENEEAVEVVEAAEGEEIVLDEELFSDDLEVVLDEEDVEVLEDEELMLLEDEEEEKEPRPEYDYHEYLKELGNYKGLEVAISPLMEVTDEMVMEEIEGRMYQYMEEVTEGTVEEGDLANIDYVGKKDGVAFEGGTDEGYDLEIGSGSFIDGFEDGLIGVKIGDTVDLNLTFPEGYPAENLAGQEVVFTVTVNYVQRVGEFSDEAAEYLSDGEYKDMASYQAAVKDELENSYKESQKSEAESLYWDAVIENSVFESMPEDVVAYDTKAYMDYEEGMIQMFYGMTYEDYCAAIGIEMEEYTAMVSEGMEENLKYEMISLAILEAEGIEITEEIFVEEATAFAEEYGYDLETFLEMEEERNIWNAIYYKKVSEILMSNNTFVESEELYEEYDAFDDTLEFDEYEDEDLEEYEDLEALDETEELE